MYCFEALQVSFMKAIVVGQEIDQQLNQPTVRPYCIDMVGGPRTLSAAEKQVSSGEQPYVSLNALPRQIENLRQLANGQVGMRAKAQDSKAIKMRCRP